MYQVDRTHVSRTFRLTDSLIILLNSENAWGGRVVRWCWVNLQFRGVLLFWTIVGQGPIGLAVGAGWGCLDIFLSSVISLFSPCLWETARYRLKYCLKGPLSPKQTNQPTENADPSQIAHTDTHSSFIFTRNKMIWNICVRVVKSLKAPNKNSSRKHFNFFYLYL